MAKNPTYIFWAWILAGAIGLPILSAVCSAPFIPDTPEARLDMIGLGPSISFLMYAFVGTVLGATTGEGFIRAKQGKVRKAGGICLWGAAPFFCMYMYGFARAFGPDFPGRGSTLGISYDLAYIAPSLIWSAANCVWGLRLLSVPPNKSVQ